jgi:hypothetical protein
MHETVPVAGCQNRLGVPVISDVLRIRIHRAMEATV